MVMSALDKLVLIDTSIWIYYFRGEKEVYNKVNELIDSGKVCSLGLVIAELIQGAKTEKEVRVIKDMATVFPQLTEGADSWEKAGVLSFQLKKVGKSIGLADCYIATIAKENEATIYTLDEHFKEIRNHIDITLTV